MMSDGAPVKLWKPFDQLYVTSIARYGE